MYKNIKKTIIFVFAFTFFIFPDMSLAYKPTTTHAGLTEQIVEFYGLSFPGKKLTKQQMEWVVQGVVDEDNPAVRALNHFYDSIL